MASKTRLYVVPAEPNEQYETGFAAHYIVEAHSHAAAQNHVNAKYVGAARLATAKDVSELMAAGVKPEKAEESK